MAGHVSERWESYYARTGQRTPRRTLLFALDCFDLEPAPREDRFAIDLGCGNGRDTIEMLRRGWPVLAIDKEPKAIEGLLARSDLPEGARIETQVATFEGAALRPADLIDSGFALPLMPQAVFPDVWARILGALKPGGRISCQLYGDRDSWCGDATISFFTRQEAEAILATLDVEMFEEEESDSTTPRGKPKHWHIFHIVARLP
jgi:tellurite methyltransferase